MRSVNSPGLQRKYKSYCKSESTFWTCGAMTDLSLEWKCLVLFHQIIYFSESEPHYALIGRVLTFSKIKVFFKNKEGGHFVKCK